MNEEQKEENETVSLDVKKMLDRIFLVLSEKLKENEAIDRMEKIKRDALEIIKKEMIHKNYNNNFRYNFITRVNSESLYDVSEEKLNSMLEAIEENNTAKELLMYILSLVNFIQISENTYDINAYFYMTYAYDNISYSLSIAQLIFVKDTKNVVINLGLYGNPIIRISTKDNTNNRNDKIQQLQGLIKLIEEFEKELEKIEEQEEQINEEQ